MSAYNKLYLDDAMQTLGEMLQYATEDCEFDPTRYWSWFIITGIADSFGKGNPRYVAGMSGAELATCTVRKAGITDELPRPSPKMLPGKHYWCGWILAYYQWLCGDSFEEIDRLLPITEVMRLYNPLHEAPEEKFVEVANRIRKSSQASTNLARLRKNSGLTQAALASRADMSLRTLQQYESRAKDINKAQAKTLLALSLALKCSMRDLMEPNLDASVEYTVVSF